MTEVMGVEAPGAKGQKFLLPAGCGRVRLVWHLGLLLQQSQVSQVLLANNSCLKAVGTEDSLEFSGRSIREASQGVEDDLAWRYLAKPSSSFFSAFCGDRTYWISLLYVLTCSAIRSLQP